MPQILVIADDLTGANDTGGQFARGGLRTTVWTRWDDSPFEADVENPCAAVDTASRHINPQDAAGRVAALARRARAAGVQAIYKKTDSTLRGNIASELGALAEVCGTVLFAPALPGSGRTVRDGIVYLEGRPLHETHFARDPLHPVRSSSVLELLRQQKVARVIHLPLGDLRGGSLRIAPDEGPQIVVVDGETEEDLGRSAELARGALGGMALAGPAGLARWLPSLVGLKGDPLQPAPLPRPILIVAGSLAPETLAQVAVVLRGGHRGLRITPEQLFPEGGREWLPHEGLLGEAAEVLGSGENLVIHTCLRREETSGYDAAAARAGLEPAEIPRVLTRRLARMAGEIVTRALPPSLVLLGGETAAAVLAETGCRRATVQAEYEPGANRLEAKLAGRTAALVTKSGGFGRPDLLAQLVADL